MFFQSYEKKRLRHLDTDLDRDAVYYEKKMKPIVQLYLAYSDLLVNHRKTEQEVIFFKELEKYIKERLDVRHLGSGQYGKILSLQIKGSRLPVAMKFQKCDSVFFKEETILKKMNRMSILLPYIGRLFDGYKSGTDCVLVLPVANGSLATMPYSKLLENLDSIICQAVASIYLFHTYLYMYHCDAHTGNWLWFQKKFKATKILGFRIKQGNVTISLYDPGLAENPEKTSETSCSSSALYDYFRFFSYFAGLGKTLESHDDDIRPFYAYFLHYAKIRKGGKDWNVVFPKKKTSDVFRDIMTIATKKMSVDQVKKRWPEMSVTSRSPTTSKKKN